MRYLCSSIKTFCWSIIPIFIFLIQPGFAQDQEGFETQQDCCDYWIFRITGDKSKMKTFMKYQGDSIFIRKDEKSIMCGIECLLKLEGNKSKASVGTNRSIYTSSADMPKPTVEIAALVYILDIFKGAPDIPVRKLYDKNPNATVDETVKKAYKYYREWFEEVKRVGLIKARQMGLDPLKNRDVYWPAPDIFPIGDKPPGNTE